MDRPASRLDFAVIGHQDSWANIHTFVNRIRTPEQGTLSVEKVKAIFPFIPARDLFRVTVTSRTGDTIKGVYIDTFIEPDKLGVTNLRTNLRKVEDAIAFAKKLEAPIVALGGFTSIFLEGELSPYASSNTRFTTGNTLTSAFIVKGVEQAAVENQLDLRSASVLIIGATGDIGRACVGYFQSRVNNLLLCARNKRRLERLAGEVKAGGGRCTSAIELSTLLPRADVIICVASSSNLALAGVKPEAIICDAGYPKNLFRDAADRPGFLFHGGMGQVEGGYRFEPDYTDSFYQYPAPDIIHGCILEAMVLAFEKRFENYSSGRGNITVEKVEEIYRLSLKHGIALAPFFNDNGLCPTRPKVSSI